MFKVIIYFIFSSVVLIGSDIYTLSTYEESGNCIPDGFDEDPIIYGIWWIFNRFISVISVNLLCLILFWRIRFKQEKLDITTYEDIKRKRDDGNQSSQSIYSHLTTESNLQKQNTNRSYNQSINDDDQSYTEEVHDSFVQKMKTFR